MSFGLNSNPDNPLTLTDLYTNRLESRLNPTVSRHDSDNKQYNYVIANRYYLAHQAGNLKEQVLASLQLSKINDINAGRAAAYLDTSAESRGPLDYASNPPTPRSAYSPIVDGTMLTRRYDVLNSNPAYPPRHSTRDQTNLRFRHTSDRRTF